MGSRVGIAKQMLTRQADVVRIGRSFYGNRALFVLWGAIVSLRVLGFRTIHANVVLLLCQSRGTIATILCCAVKDHPIDASKVEYSYNPIYDHLQHSFICRFAQDKETLL